MLRTKIMAAVLTAAMALPVVATASTLNLGADNININKDYDYQDTYKTNSGAKTLTFNLTAITKLLLGGGVSTLEVTGVFAGLSVKLDGVAANVVFGGPLARVYSFNPLAFATGATKTLVISWTNVTKNPKKGVAQVNLQLATSPVPLPAGGLLLAGALGGFAALRRRNKSL